MTKSIFSVRVDATRRELKTDPHTGNLRLTSPKPSAINNIAAVAASRLLCSRTTRGDLGQLAPRKKLLKSFSSFLEDFLRPSEHFGTEGFSFLPSLLP